MKLLPTLQVFFQKFAYKAAIPSSPKATINIRYQD